MQVVYKIWPQIKIYMQSAPAIGLIGDSPSSTFGTPCTSDPFDFYRYPYKTYNIVAVYSIAMKHARQWKGEERKLLWIMYVELKSVSKPQKGGLLMRGIAIYWSYSVFKSIIQSQIYTTSVTMTIVCIYITLSARLIKRVGPSFIKNWIFKCPSARI